MRRQRGVDAAQSCAGNDGREPVASGFSVRAHAGADDPTAAAIARADDAATIAVTVAIAVYSGV